MYVLHFNLSLSYFTEENVIFGWIFFINKMKQMTETSSFWVVKQMTETSSFWVVKQMTETYSYLDSECRYYSFILNPPLQKKPNFFIILKKKNKKNKYEK